MSIVTFLFLQKKTFRQEQSVVVSAVEISIRKADGRKEVVALTFVRELSRLLKEFVATGEKCEETRIELIQQRKNLSSIVRESFEKKRANGRT